MGGGRTGIKGKAKGRVDKLCRVDEPYRSLALPQGSGRGDQY